LETFPRKNSGTRCQCIIIMKKKSAKKSKSLSCFFDKRISSFLFHLNNAKLAGYISDIHKTRVEMKKLMTLLSLFSQFGKEKLGLKKKETRLFNKLHQKSGKIRETQLNLKYLEKYHVGNFEILAYRKKLERDEKIFLRNFLMASTGFDNRKLEKVSTRINDLIARMDIDQFIAVARKFIRRKTEEIKQLQDDMHDRKNAHKIRKRLKAIATIVTVLYLVHPDQSSIKYLSNLNRTEKMIGSWHDKVVFLSSIERFIRKSAGNSDQTIMSVHQLKTTVSEECDDIYGQLSRSWVL
jgi:hypothetical protein